MRKILTLFIVFVLTAIQASAVRPLRGRYFVRTQSDGTQIIVERMGDGHNGVVFYATQDGITLVQNSNGDLCYATPSGNRLRASSFIAHEHANRSGAEHTYVQSNALTIEHASEIVKHRSRRMQVNRISTGTSSRNDGLGTYGKTASGAVPSIGEFTMPVIMVEFSDVKFQASTTQAVLSRQYNQEGYTDENGSVGSARDYFISQSGGLFRPTFEVAAKVTLTRSRAYYGKDRSEDEIDINLNKFRDDALNAAVAAGVDFSKYVYKGGVPCVIFLYAGQGEANSYEDAASDYLWPCEWDDDSDYTLGGKKVHINSFFVGNEIQYDYDVDTYNSRTGEYTYKVVGDPMLEGIGTFCHEFGHALGLPDFYCTDYSHEIMPMGFWDIMDMGSYLNDGYAPIGHTAYEKNFLGWLEIRELTEAETVTLRPFGSTGDHAVLVRNDSDPKEYYIFENRQQGTWYPTEMSGGMLAVHVAFNASEWINNTLNNSSNKLRMQVFAADGALTSPYGDIEDHQTDLFPGSRNKTQILNTGTPSMKAYTGTYMNKPLYRIALNGENITFNFLQDEISTIPIGNTFTHEGLTYEVTKGGEVYVTAAKETAYSGNITIPASIVYDNVTWKVVGIRTDAFSDCASLTSLTIGRNVVDIERGAFRHTPQLTSLQVDANNGTYESINGVLYTKHVDKASGQEGSVLFDFENNVLNLPTSTQTNQTTGIFTGPTTYQGITLTATHGTTPTRLWESTNGMSMRIYNTGTLTFSVPDGATITQIVFTTTSTAWNIKTASTGTLNAKTWTGNAQSVTFTNSGGGTFIGSIEVTTEGLSNATPWQLIKAPASNGGAFDVPEDVTNLADFAFEDAGYTAISLPTTLTALGYASLSMSTLTTLVANAEEPATCTGAPFEAVDKSVCKLYVPEGTNAQYAAADYWKEFLNISTITTGIAPVWAQPAKQQHWYDLQGRPVHQPTHGIYILNGKKVVR